MKTIEEFDALGWHRTGAPADQATTGWLIEQLARIGIAAQPSSFSFPKVEVERARIVVGDALIAGHPPFDAGFTDPGGIRAPLALTAENVTGRIVLNYASGPVGITAFSTS